MLFCRKCGSILKVEGKQGICVSCGYEIDVEFGIRTREKIKEKEETGNGIIKQGLNPNATYPNKCKKCGYDKSELLYLGVFVSDEGEAWDYVCGKCGAHERERGGQKSM